MFTKTLFKKSNLVLASKVAATTGISYFCYQIINSNIDYEAFKNELVALLLLELLEAGPFDIIRIQPMKNALPHGSLFPPPKWQNAMLHDDSLEHAQDLIDAGYNLNSACKLLNWSRLVREVATKDIESLSSYLKQIDLKDRVHNTPLAMEIAVKLNRPDVLRKLIEAGGNVNTIYRLNRTLAYWAAEMGHVACLQVLVGAGADPNVIVKYEAKDPLCIAMSNKHYNCIDLLLEAPNLTMAALVEDPFYLHLFKPLMRNPTSDSYLKNSEYHTKVKERYEGIIKYNQEEDEYFNSCRQ